MATFLHAGHRLAYTVYGDGPRTVVLLHGLLLSQKMHKPLAHALAARGNRVITMDLLGHGESDRPRDMAKHSMIFYGEQVVALLDHLDVDEAVIGGASLGANTALEVAVAAPERVRGLVLEMPVLDHALLGCAIAFTPLMCWLTFGEPVMKGVSWITRRIPTGRLWGADVLLDTVRQAPSPSAAVLQGLFFGRVAPHAALRRGIAAPALVIGHELDPVHPFTDSDALAGELPGGRLVRARSVLELRTTPRRLTEEIAGFLDECWMPRGKGRARAPRAPRAAGAA
ncbi:alpha/beta hydrolase [Baekduia soli]|uniref:Alpha/beta hydrolase n=1 Tax=Baekduia soli TaxID=496014 RepID=A0A5B8U1F6_9ACTN|nr:alpha/beta hydrolase [Baekduia soli]QEC46904.1 alpha/beta hydrolase [Baekduia soli]